MCTQVLEIDPRKIGKRKNEDHFCPPEFKERIEEIVQYLIVEKKITRSDVSLFSCSLILADAMLTAALRKQDTLGQLARDLHRLNCQDVHGDAVAITRCLLPRFFKNKKALENSTCGVVVNHTKNEKCEGAHAVMTVIGRKVMRRLLENEVEKERAELRKNGGCTEKALERVAESYTLTPHLGPFNESGCRFSPNQLTRMYKWLGQRTMGISHFGPHIIRTNHATTVAMYCVRKGLSRDDQAVKDLFALARHGEKQRIKFYTQVSADMPNACLFMTNFGGVNSSLCQLAGGVEDEAAEMKIKTVGDIGEVGLSGIFAFKDFSPDELEASVRGKSVGGDGANRRLKVVEMDEEEKALAKKVRMARMEAEIASLEAKKAEAEEAVETGGDKKGGVRANELEYRKSAFSKMNQLILEASEKTLKEWGKDKQPNRDTLEYNLKYNQQTMRVAFNDNVKRFLYSLKPGEKEFLDVFYSKLKEKSEKTKAGSKAEGYRKENKIERRYHDWSSGDVRVGVPQKDGKKRKSDGGGNGKSENKKKV